MQLDYYVHICSDTKRDRCGMYPKKTLSAASLLSECERKRCRSLEARGCAKSESEFSMGTAATCPFIMSEQSPRTSKHEKRGYLAVTSLALTGNFLSSQAVSSQVLSAFMCLTTVFGMGTGGTSPSLPPVGSSTHFFHLSATRFGS